ncbi:MAG: KpsF/GutQ family sugar-phosphate isomerase [Candidatus Omnitrophica bacterium]|nr:KpsF/GutQ family sugar-phosphate isomerase [Candidatus Omnitrophota bacterium]
MKSAVASRARAVLAIERDAISRLIPRIDRRFESAVELLSRCVGRVVVTGMGKPGFIAQKVSATLSSLGVPSLWLHPAEAAHGDLGRVTAQDVVLAFSHSGETDEILHLVPVLKKIGTRLIAVTGHTGSRLAKQADAVLDTGVAREASPWGLVPTASTTAMLAMGDALAVALAEKRGFTPRDFAILHPGGSLGKRLTMKVDDLMRTGSSNPVVREEDTVKKVLLTITKARCGSASVVDKKGKLIGIFTDGDLRRHLEEDPLLLKRRVCQVMTKNPKVLPAGHLAVEALKILKGYKIDEIPVVDRKSRPVGLLDIQDLLKAGLV